MWVYKKVIIVIFVVILVTGCQEESTGNEPQPCEEGDTELMIDRWNSPVFDGAIESCIDTLCIEFELELYEDATYAMNYLLFNSFQDSIQIHSLVDTGTYDFICESKGIFTTRFTYSYVEGVLELNSITEPLRTLGIRWDGFWGLDINPEDLGLGFSARLLLQRDE